MDRPESSFVRDPRNLSYWYSSYLLHMISITNLWAAFPRCSRGHGCLHIRHRRRRMSYRRQSRCHCTRGGKRSGWSSAASPLAVAEARGSGVVAHCRNCEGLKKGCKMVRWWIHKLSSDLISKISSSLELTVTFYTLSCFFGWHWFRSWYKFVPA